MFVAKVTGSLVATQKAAAMVGHKLLVVEPYRVDPQNRGSLVTTGRTFVAVEARSRRASIGWWVSLDAPLGSVRVAKGGPGGTALRR